MATDCQCHGVRVGIQRVKFLIINLNLLLPSKIIREGGEASKLAKSKLPYSLLTKRVYQTYKDADQSVTSAVYKTGVFIFIKGHFNIREIRFRITFSLKFAKRQRFPFTFRLLFVINKWFQARLTVFICSFPNLRNCHEVESYVWRLLF